MKARFDNIQGRLKNQKVTFIIELDFDEYNHLRDSTQYHIPEWFENILNKEYQSLIATKPKNLREGINESWCPNEQCYYCSKFSQNQEQSKQQKGYCSRYGCDVNEYQVCDEIVRRC